MVDRILKRQLQTIDNDKHSGANELALRAVNAVQAWVQRNRKATDRDLLQVARALLETQPEMAPLFRLANEVALATDADDPAVELLEAFCRLETVLKRGAALIARQFRRAIERGPRKTILTYSYSSTVLRALIQNKSRIRQIYCSEASPGMEGRELARKLAKSGLRPTLTTDLALPGFIRGADDAHPRPDAIVVGADQMRPRKFVNRYGTEILVEQAGKDNVPFWVLTDTTKFIPEVEWRASKSQTATSSRLQDGAPRGVESWLRLLGEAPLASHVRVLTERGWMTGEQVRRAIRQIFISPRLKGLLETRD